MMISEKRLTQLAAAGGHVLVRQVRLGLFVLLSTWLSFATNPHAEIDD